MRWPRLLLEPLMQVSDKGVGLIARFEGKRLQAYLDSRGIPTVGYGHTSRAGSPLVSMGMSITEDQALAILHNDVEVFSYAVMRVLRRIPTQNQFDAMVSLAFNIGAPAFGGSTVLADFNAGDELGAAQAFLMWVKAGGMALPGLVARRQQEKLLFETVDAQPETPAVAASKPQQMPSGLIGLLMIILTTLFRKASK